MDTQREVAARYRSGTITQEQAQLEIELYWAGALRKAVIDGDVENGSLMAGQSVGMLNKVQPLREILQDLVDEADEGLARAEKMLS